MADIDAAVAKMIDNLAANTGKDLNAWIAIAKSSGQARHGAVVSWLKAEQGLSHGYANLIAHKTFASDAGSSGDDDLMAAMFEGPKAAMKPVYDKVAAMLSGLDGVEFAPKKGYVSFRRAKQFGLGQPSTKDRFDLGLTLRGFEPSGRLEAAGSWNAMVTHRVRLTAPEQVDAEVEGWIRDAWDKA